MTSFAPLSLERPVVYRETAVQMYHPAAYSIAQIVFELPIAFIGANIFLLLLMVAFVDFPNEGAGVYFFVSRCSTSPRSARLA